MAGQCPACGLCRGIPTGGMFSLIIQREMCIDLLSPGVLRGCRVILMGLKEATGSS